MSTINYLGSDIQTLNQLATELNLSGFPSYSTQIDTLLVIMFTETPYNYLGTKKKNLPWQDFHVKLRIVLSISD